jgi:membrane-bound inhibitor of C-type lysozyme
MAVAGLFAAPLLLAGCTGSDGGGLIDLGGLTGDQTVRYRCDDDRELRVTYNSDRDRATVQAGDRTYRLRLEDRDGDRRRYGEDEVQLTVDGDEARLRIEGGSDYSDCEET